MPCKNKLGFFCRNSPCNLSQLHILLLNGGGYLYSSIINNYESKPGTVHHHRGICAD